MKFLLLLIGSVFFPLYLVAAADDNKSSWGEIEGLIRTYYIFTPAYIKTDTTVNKAINGSALGGHLRYKSPLFAKVGTTLAVYYAMDSGLNAYSFNDPDVINAAGRFFTSDYSPHAVLGELNLHYTDTKHKAVLGRQKIDSPLTNAIFTFMPNMFEAFVYENSSFKENTIKLGHIETMAYGTRTPVEFGLIGELTATAGASANGLETRGEFIDIENQTLGNANVQGTNTSGLTTFALENRSLTNTTLRVWDFYAYDIINMFYLDAIYNDKKASLPYSLSAQYLRVDGTGKNLASASLDAGDAFLLGLKATMSYEKSLFYLAYNHSGDAKIFNPWGGDPAYTSSFFSKNAYRANVDAFKLGYNYAFQPNLKLLSAYAHYGKSTTNGFFGPLFVPGTDTPQAPDDSSIETSVLISYNPIKKLNILTGVIYKTSEYYYQGEQIQIFDIDLLITYKF